MSQSLMLTTLFPLNIISPLSTAVANFYFLKFPSQLMPFSVSAIGGGNYCIKMYINVPPPARSLTSSIFFLMSSGNHCSSLSTPSMAAFIRSSGIRDGSSTCMHFRADRSSLAETKGKYWSVGNNVPVNNYKNDSRANKNRLCSKTCGIDKKEKNPKEKIYSGIQSDFL